MNKRLGIAMHMCTKQILHNELVWIEALNTVWLSLSDEIQVISKLKSVKVTVSMVVGCLFVGHGVFWEV